MIDIYNKLVPQNGYIIGETACGHEGDIKKLIQLIDCISNSGAQIVKFQIFIPKERVTENHPEWKLFNDLTLAEEDWLYAAKYAKEKNLIILADIFGEKGFSIAEKIDVDGYKVHSEDLLNTGLIKKIAMKKKLLLIGVGASHRLEIYELLNYLNDKDLCKNIVLMPGVQTFPTPLEAHSLEEVTDLINNYSLEFRVKVGFADHIDGDLPEAMTVPLLALAKGACLIEKHITIDRASKWEDYESALSGDNFKKLIDNIKKILPLFYPVKEMNQFEIQYRNNFKKTAVINTEVKKGDVLNYDSFVFEKYEDLKIPLSGINLEGKVILKSIKSDTPLRNSMFKANIGGIIVARCNSSRLPNKALMKIENRETIALLIERIKRCNNLSSIILATSKDSSDDKLIEIAKREGISYFRGSLDNVSSRFYNAAKEFNLDYVVRITGDDILRDEKMIDKAVESHLHKSYDVTFTKNMPYGTSSEVFSFKVLEAIINTVNVPSNTEYLEYYLENDRYFSVNYVDSGYQFNKNLRLTLDYEEDFKFFNLIFKNFYSSNPNFTIDDVLSWVIDNEKLMSINSNKKIKFGKQDLDVSLKI